MGRDCPDCQRVLSAFTHHRLYEPVQTDTPEVRTHCRDEQVRAAHIIYVATGAWDQAASDRIAAFNSAVGKEVRTER